MSPNRVKNVYVTGHTTPDTDSVCSAIAYAYFKNITDKRYVFTPARAGKLNHETSFVLERFGVPPSAEIDSLVATVSDLDLKKPIAVQCAGLHPGPGAHDARAERAVRARGGRLRQACRRRRAQGHRPPLHGQRGFRGPFEGAHRARHPAQDA